MKGVLAFGSLVVVLVLALYGSSLSDAAKPPTVPTHVRNAIVHDYPAMAWIPGWLPKGYRFASWTHSKRPRYFEYQLAFVKKSGGKITSQIAFQVFRRSCPTAPSWRAQGTFHVNGHTIEWSSTNTATYAWRCMKSAPRFVIFGANGPVLKLAYLVGFARPAS